MEIKKRNPLAAVAFSIISPGLGQIYNGQFKKGIIYAIITILILIFYYIMGVYFIGFIISLFILICWCLFIIFDSLITSSRIKYIELNEYNKWYIYLFFIVAITFTSFTAETLLKGITSYSIPARSMQQTFLKGDYLISNNFAYGWKTPFSNKGWLLIDKPHRGDVAVFIFPPDPSKEYIKRVIGLPGDRVQIIDKQVFINGQLLETPQAVFRDTAIIPSSKTTRDNFGPVTVPPDSYFVLGDNRDQSYDSRFWGFVPLDLIRGKALYVYFSWDKENSRIRWERIGLAVN